MEPNRVLIIEAMLCFIVVICMNISILKCHIKYVNVIMVDLFSSLNLKCKQLYT